MSIRCLFVLSCAVLFAPARAHAAAVELFGTVATKAATVDGVPTRDVRGTVGAHVFDAHELAFTLPDGRTVVARRTHMERAPESTTWSGAIGSGAEGTLTLTRYRSVLTGVVRIDGSVYEVLPDADGHHALVASDAVAARGLEPAGLRGRRKATSRSVVRAVVGALSGEHAPVVQDVAVLYTAAAAARRGRGALESMIAGGIAAANEAYRDSGVGITLRLVDVGQSGVVESATGMVDTLARFRAAPETRALRDRLAADIMLLVNESRDWCGYAYIMFEPTADYVDAAYGAVRSGCIATDMIAHEIGHIQGLMHDRETTPEDDALPYGHGYRVCQPGGFRDLMSYACANASVTRVRRFSNPTLAWRGQPMGIAHETAPAASADAARALNETAAIVAAYRTAENSTPAGPLRLRAARRAGSVTLSWRDSSDDETAFVVERSSNGGRFAEIARVPRNEATFRDTTVVASAAYTYRVAAENGAGRSASSNVVTVHARAARWARDDAFRSERNRLSVTVR